MNGGALGFHQGGEGGLTKLVDVVNDSEQPEETSFRGGPVEGRRNR